MTLPPPATTTCTQRTLDVTRATVGDHHGLRALAAAHRRAGRHRRELGLLGASRTVQRAALQLVAASPPSLPTRAARTDHRLRGHGEALARPGAVLRPRHARRAFLRVE